MENLKIKCNCCGSEVIGRSGKTVSCGCPNMATIKNNENITAYDLSKILMINSKGSTINRTKSLFSSEDMAWHEARKNRKIRKLDFEVR